MPAAASDSPSLRQAAEFLRFASEPIRCRIIIALREPGILTDELSRIAGVDRASLAHHSRMLRVGGLVETHRTGNGTSHQLTPKGIKLLAVLDDLTAADTTD